MKKSKTYLNKKYTLSNEEEIKVGDKVFPISYGAGGHMGEPYQHIGWDFNEIRSGFPDNPHIVTEIKKSCDCCGNKDSDGFVTIFTDRGHAIKEIYFKIKDIKKIES